MALDEVRWPQKYLGFIIWEPWISAPTFVPTHPVDADIFHKISENSYLLVALE